MVVVAVGDTFVNVRLSSTSVHIYICNPPTKCGFHNVPEEDPFGLCRRYHKHTAHFPENSPTEERKEKIVKVQMISLTQPVSSTAFSRLSPPGWFQQTPPFLCKILNYIGSHCGICPYPHFEPMFDGLHGEVLLGEDLLCIFSVRIVCFKEWLLKSSDYWAARVPQCSHCWWGWGRWRAP